MKRLNPTTGSPFKRGDVREDGRIFRCYAKTIVKINGFFEESWLTPKATQQQINKQSEIHNNNISTKNGHIKRLLTAVKSRAKSKNIPFNVSLEDAIKIAPDVCPILNIKLGWCERNNKIKPQSPSLDRIDPKKGYVLGNIQWLSLKANAMKQNANNEELLMFADWVNKTLRV